MTASDLSGKVTSMKSTSSLPSRVFCWIVSISFIRRFGRPPGKEFAPINK